MLGLGGGVAGQGFGATPESQLRPLSRIVQGLTAVATTAEAIDRWFEDLQSYEATLEEMAAASLDANFKEEARLSSILGDIGADEHRS